MKRTIQVLALIIFSNIGAIAQPDSVYRLSSISRYYNSTNGMVKGDTGTMKYIGKNHSTDLEVYNIYNMLFHDYWAFNNSEYVELDQTTGMPSHTDREIKTFDTVGNYITVTRYFLNKGPNTTSWDTTIMYVDSFENKNKLSHTLYVYVNGTFAALSRNEYKTNSNGDEIEATTFKWNNMNNVWEEDSKTTTSYSGVLMDSRALYKWNINTTQWDSFQRQTYTYQSGLLVQDSIERYNPNSKKWNNSQKFVYTYDNNGNRDTLRRYKWMFTTTPNDWNLELDQFLEYDSKSRLIAYQSKILNGQSFKPSNRFEYEYFNDTLVKNHTQLMWDATSQQFKKQSTSNYFYEKIRLSPLSIISQTKNNEEAFVVYPIPATNTLYVRNENYVQADYILYDMAGKLISKGSIDKGSTKPISITTLSTGLYIVELTTLNGKTVKQVSICK